MAEKIKRLENSLKTRLWLSYNVHYVNYLFNLVDGVSFFSQNGTPATPHPNKNNFAFLDFMQKQKIFQRKANKGGKKFNKMDKNANKMDKMGASGDKPGKKAKKVDKIALTERLWFNYKAGLRKCHQDDL